MFLPTLSSLPTPNERHAAYQQGETVVLALFETQAELIRVLDSRVQALQGQIAKNNLNGQRVWDVRYQALNRTLYSPSFILAQVIE